MLRLRSPLNQPYQITSPFGYREYIFNGNLIKENHTGIDFINTNRDRRVYPLLAGIVLIAQWHESSGFYVVIQHSKDDGLTYFSKYCHLETLHIMNGDEVTTGRVLGEYGLVGKTTGAHVHVEFYNQDWSPIDYREMIR